MRDTLDRAILGGDDIVYAVKQSTSIAMKQARVITVEDARIFVRPVNGKKTWLTVSNNIVILAELDFVDDRDHTEVAV